MALEDLTGNKYINALDAGNPVGTADFVASLDDHIRGIKNVLKKSFPAINGAVNASPAELNRLDGITVSTTELNRLAGVSSNVQTQLNTNASNISSLDSAKAPKANPTFTGTVTVSDRLRVDKTYDEKAVALGTSGTLTCNLASGTLFYTGTLAGNTTFVFSNPVASGRVTSFTLELSNAAGYTITWPASVKWNEGTEPAWSAGKDIVSFYTRDGGTTWYGFASGLDMS